MIIIKTLDTTFFWNMDFPAYHFWFIICKSLYGGVIFELIYFCQNHVCVTREYGDNILPPLGFSMLDTRQNLSWYNNAHEWMIVTNTHDTVTLLMNAFVEYLDVVHASGFFVSTL